MVGSRFGAYSRMPKRRIDRRTPSGGHASMPSAQCSSTPWTVARLDGPQHRDANADSNPSSRKECVSSSTELGASLLPCCAKYAKLGFAGKQPLETGKPSNLMPLLGMGPGHKLLARQLNPRPAKRLRADIQHRQHMAVAAGVAAATITSSAISSAASTTAAFLGALMSGLMHPSMFLQLSTSAFDASSDFLLNRFESAVVSNVTAAAVDVTISPAACACLRLSLRSRVRVAMAGMSILCFLWALAHALSHLGFDHDATKTLLHLAGSGPGLMENCRELLQVGCALGVGVANSSNSKSKN
ncbi:hypothetical protein Agub_g6345 [Astrephomene gubernaculifera]|uniref:Uncharacterized protein n=1 Tax=Astrephomene gubernaculifera TaxID=47775 RepID=A0AAD3DRC7_9CHLO|nr:hypothetical protein Agub_g6345 [Astrephomene gubernaculifera]